MLLATRAVMSNFKMKDRSSKGRKKSKNLLQFELFAFDFSCVRCTYVRAHSTAINLNLIREEKKKKNLHVCRAKWEKNAPSEWTHHTHPWIFLNIYHGGDDDDFSFILSACESAPVPVRCVCQNWRANSRILIFSPPRTNWYKKKNNIFVKNVYLLWIFIWCSTAVFLWLSIAWSCSTTVWCKSVDWCVYSFELMHCDCDELASIQILAHMRDNWTK